MKPGHWLVRVVRNGIWTPSRLYLCRHEPGVPENILDRRPYWRGQIGLDEVDPLDLWQMVYFAELTAAERAALINPPLSERAPRGNREQAQQWAPPAKWKQERACRISADTFAAHIDRLRWLDQHKPNDHRLRYREPVAVADLPLPEFMEL